MGLFTHEEKPPEDPLIEIRSSVNDFERRMMHLEASSASIDRDILSKDHELESYYESVKQQMQSIKDETESIRREVMEADMMLKQIIRNLRTLAQQKDLKDLNDMVRVMKIDSLVTEDDMKAMISDLENNKL